MDNKALLEKAMEARKHAHCPYSRFPVGAALLCADGTVYTGANVENAVNSLSICAERVALFNAISAGQHDLVKLAVVCEAAYCRPCGACRQVLYEHAPDLKIVMGSSQGTYKSTTISNLLPEAFSL